MTRTTLAVTLVLASYTLASLAVSPIAAAVAARWRVRAGAIPARAWFWLRMSPPAAGLAASLGLVLPAFAAYEPPREAEQAGPWLMVLAALALVPVIVSAVRLLRARWIVWRFNRAILSSATIARLDGTPLPLHVVDQMGPLVGLIGVLRPRLVLSSHVRSLCSGKELATIAAHEAAHLGARDNLKRLLLDACPDLLRWTPLHARIVRAWSSAAEREADDAAANTGDRGARVALASLLIKLARLSAPPMPLPPLSSSLIGEDDLAYRVKRLLEEPTPSPRQSAWGTTVLGALAATAFGCTWSMPELLEGVHHVSERLVGLGL